MESQVFKAWATAENLVYKSNIAELAGRHILFDAEHYLHSILTDTQTREPLLPALGGLPFALQQHVDRDLANLQSAGVSPMFIFNGLELACKDRKSINRESQKAVNILDDAWRVYDQGHGDDAVIAFGKACTYRTSHILRHLHFYLHRKGQYTMVAPFSSAAQIPYMYDKDCASAAYGPPSVLFGMSTLITGFEWDNKQREMCFVVKDEVLAKLQLNSTQFTDLCLISGLSIIAPIPEVRADTSSTSRITLGRNVLARSGNDGHTACMRANDEEYLTLFRKAKAALKHMVIIQENGEVKQLDFENAPGDTHEFVGTRLPDELLAYHQHGLIGSRVLNWRARQELFETPPLDGGSSQTYKDLVQTKLRPLRTRSLAVLTRSLHRYFSKQEVHLHCWFSENGGQALGVKDLDTNDVTRDAETWHVKEALMAQSNEANKIDQSRSPILYAITFLSDDNLAKKTVTRRQEGQHSLLVKQSELLSNMTWRFLQDRGYINSDHTLSAWGKALKAALDRARRDGLLDEKNPPHEIEEALFLAFELLRLELLSNKPLFPTPPYNGAPMRGSDADRANVLLVSRIACLATFQHDAIGYTGPLSRHLLAFHQTAAAVRNSLRDLVEVHGANMMLSASAVRLRDNSDYTDVGSNLPFSKEPDLGLALVVKSHLDELSSGAGRRADISKWFNHALDIRADLTKAWYLWNAVNEGVQAADSAIVSSETKALFENTDKWLVEKPLVLEGSYA